MATATKKGRAARTADVKRSDPSVFRVFESNDGDYHWVIVAGDGAILAQSGSFASFDAAQAAALSVHRGAAIARFEEGPLGVATGGF